MSEENKYHLQELDGSGYEIVDGEPNIIGWDVSDGKGQKVGEVDDLLFDAESRKVRYLIVDLDNDYVDIEDDKKVLIPIGLAQLHGKKTDSVNNTTATGLEGEPVVDESAAAAYVGTAFNEDRDFDLDKDDDLVVIPNITAAQLLMLPTYDKDNLSYDQERLVRNVFESGSIAAAGAATTDFDSSNFYQHDYYNEDRFYQAGDLRNEDTFATKNDKSSIPVVEENIEVGKKEVQTGGARITSRIVERQVKEDINLREERVTVERKPVDRPVTNADEAFQETEIELTEHAEVPVVNKEARIVEEISLNKEVDENEETIHDTVRKTEVDIEDLSGNDETTRGIIDEEDDDEIL